ncbi:DUF3120 domain-containing protein [Synechococcus sp. NOUM97013]|uniref:DUF3120 domain-containing protein n=1 Tax=Synechococcus sp. NOUM97013 TaxID=1442555 RepID=UPI00186174DE|nr:DUF3120 domain-containing protein [Synechococcus sp. NOUM97013]QNI74614.1 uncharacterized membrane protein (DUF3120) [Synechococcus sp. NOUM97013]
MFSGLIRNQSLAEPVQTTTLGFAAIPFWASCLVVLPVFAQAPWVRAQPFSAALFGFVLLVAGLLSHWLAPTKGKDLGALLVGFSGSWLAGSLFWGWLSSHPLLHLPVEAFALPLALTGLNTRWRLGCAFYLASLLGTGFTDLAMALTNVMPLWPSVVTATPSEAALLLQEAAARVMRPESFLVISASAVLILRLVRDCRIRSLNATPWSTSWAVAASVLFTTLLIDGLFLTLSLLAPELSGLI